MILAFIWVGSVALAVAVTPHTLKTNLEFSIGEMTSILPIPGALFMLPARILSPAIVIPRSPALIIRDLHAGGHFGLGVLLHFIALIFQNGDSSTIRSYFYV